MKLKLITLALLSALCLSACAEAAQTTIVPPDRDTQINAPADPTPDTTQDPLDFSGYLQSDKYYRAYFGIEKRLTDAIERFSDKKTADGFAEMFSETEQYNIGAFCEYFSIDIEEYMYLSENSRSEKDLAYASVDSMLHFKEILAESDYNKKLDTYKGFVYRSYFGDFQNSPVFVKKGYDTSKADDVRILPDGECKHTSYYHTIDAALIAHVGESAFASFESAYRGSEDFNIIKFISHFGISEETFDSVYKDVALKPYNKLYLFGGDAKISEYFEKKDVNIAIGLEDGYTFKYNELYTQRIPDDIRDKLIEKEKYEALCEKYEGAVLPIGLVCEYFSITEAEYKAACEQSTVYTKNKAAIDSLREKIASGQNTDPTLLTQYAPYMWELHFGDYYDDPVFLSDKYDRKLQKNLSVIPKDAAHVSLFYTIDYRLMQYVGAANVIEFKERFDATEQFNIVKFIEYFDISEEEYEDIVYEYALSGNTKLLFTKPYPTEALFSEGAADGSFFKIK